MMIKNAKRFLAFFVSVVMLFTCTVSVYGAKTKEELEQEIADRNKEIEELKDAIASNNADKKEQQKFVDSYMAQIDNYQEQIDVLNGDIAVLEGEKTEIQNKIDELDSEISGIEDNIDENEKEVDRTQTEIEDVYVMLQDRLCEVYVNGATSDIELLFDLDGDEDFSTYLILRELSQQLAKRDEDMVNKLNDDIARIDELTEEYNRMIGDIEVKKGEQQTKIDELSVKENSIVESRTELEKSQSEIQKLTDEVNAVISKLDADSSAKQQLIEKYEAEKDKFEQEIDKITGGGSSGPGIIQKGDLIWPLQYSDVYISSHYGWRTLYGRQNFHRGVDTCCWSGTSNKRVSAAADGVVVIATYNAGGYGWYVNIDHGGGVYTVYGHNNQLLVSPGQHVKQGQTIAYAGSTGNSTGAHVHFEVRRGINDRAHTVNPLDYVSIP